MTCDKILKKIGPWEGDQMGVKRGQKGVKKGSKMAAYDVFGIIKHLNVELTD